MTTMHTWALRKFIRSTTEVEEKCERNLTTKFRSSIFVKFVSQSMLENNNFFFKIAKFVSLGMITGGRLPPGAEGSIAQNMAAGGTTPGGRKRPNRANTRLTDHSYGYHYEDDDAYGSILPGYDEGMVKEKFTKFSGEPRHACKKNVILRPHFGRNSTEIFKLCSNSKIRC